jgi:hypothetical protein
MDVCGTVRYEGKALSSGTIPFLGSDGATYPATIGSDGTYRARVRVGEVGECLVGHRLPRRDRAAPVATPDSL